MNVLLDSSNFHEEWAYERFSRFIDQTTRITVIPFAFHEDWVKDNDEWLACYDRVNGKFYKGIVDPFLHFGVSEAHIRWVNYFESTASDLSELLKSTDIIYFIGGFPDRTINRLIELNMIESINAFKGIIMGWSAGASMQSAKYYIAPDKYYKVYSRQTGLNHINDFAVQVHYSGGAEQIESMNKFIRDTGLRVYTLERNSALIVKDDHLELIGNAKEYSGYQILKF